MALTGAGNVNEALTLVGELLAAEGHEYAVTILGGAALNLLGIVQRTTTDVDILAFASPWSGDITPNRIPLHEPPEPMPEPLARAARTVARDLDLDPRWLNTGPALQWRAGLPADLEMRVHWRRCASLLVGVVDRYDLVFFKLFAAADSAGPKSVHYQDLIALKPAIAELEAAASWVREQDVSPEFRNVLDRVLADVRTDLGLI
jgi:hypothetical protein